MLLIAKSIYNLFSNLGKPTLPNLCISEKLDFKCQATNLPVCKFTEQPSVHSEQKMRIISAG